MHGLSSTGNTTHRFPHQRLGVKAAFPGENHVGPDSLFLKTYGIKDHINTTPESTAKKSCCPRAHAPRRSRTRLIGDGDSKVLPHHGSQMRQPVIQSVHHSCVSPFLGAKNCRRTTLPAERIIDIAHHRHCYPVKTAVQQLHIDMMDHLQCRPRGHKGVSRFIVEHRPQGSCRTAAAVVGGTTPQPKNDMLCSFLKGFSHEFPYAKGCCLFHLTTISHQRQPCCRRHFNDYCTIR